MHLLLLLLLFFGSNKLFGQNKLDSLANLPWVTLISKSDLEKHSVREIKVFHFLTADDKQRLPVHEKVHSKMGIYLYDGNGNLTSVNYYFSGFDSTGTDHLPEKKSAWLINGKNFTYNQKGQRLRQRNFGAGIDSDADYYYDDAGKLQMVQYLKKSGSTTGTTLARRVLYGYYSHDGKLKYKVELDDLSRPVKNFYYVYNDNKLHGVKADVEAEDFIEYTPYKDFGNINSNTIFIDGLRIDRFMMTKLKTRNLMALLEIDEEDYIYFNISR